MKSDRLRAFSKPHSGGDNSNAQPQEIVLLEETDLYKYHQQQQHLQQHPEQAQLQYHHQPPTRHPLQQQQPYGYARAPSTTIASSEAPDYHGSGRHYMHAPATVSRKPSITSVDTVPLNHGALRPGGAVDLFSKQYIGLLLNWMLVGFFNMAIQTQIEKLGGLVAFKDNQIAATAALLNAPFQLKFLAGFITDCIPINRQRRKPYLFIGWTVLMLFMVGMAFLAEPTKASTNASTFVIAITCGSLARVLLMSTCEGLMIEYAQREGEFFRGRTLAWCLIFRFIGETVGTMALAMALHSKKYEGSFDYAVPFSVIFGFYAVVCVAGIVITRLWLVEDKSMVGNQRFGSQLRSIWRILQQRTTWQITVFGFMLKLAATYQAYEYKRFISVWLKAPKSLGLSLIEAVSSSGNIFAALLFMLFLLNTNWRKTLFWSVALGLVFMVPSEMLAVFNVFRNFVLMTIMNQLVGVTDAMLYVLRIVTIIEVVDPGYEAVTYGIITTVLNLASNVVTLFKNLVGTTFTAEQISLDHDNEANRWHLAYQFIFKYALRIVVVPVVWHLLPRQKRHLKERKLRSNPSLVVPIILFVLMAALFVMAVTANLLAQFPSTYCHVFAGGKGCK